MAAKITVVGAGTMGHGIAHSAAAVGIRVLLHDVSEQAVAAGIDAVRKDLEQGIAKGKGTAALRDEVLSRILPAMDLNAAVAESEIVVEAVPESLPLKRELFARLDRAARPGTLLATNTSALPIGEIAAATNRPERVVGMHFFNPVHLMTLVEVVRATSTSLDSVARAVALGRQMGKEPIVVRDVPGFATSRLGVVLGLEAMRMVEQEVASAEDIDKAMTLGYRHPMGPLRLTDLIGLDVRLAIAEHLHERLKSEAFRPPEILKRFVREGKLGKKTGEGFYRWDDR